MKKAVCLLTAMVLVSGIFSGCREEDPRTKAAMTIGEAVDITSEELTGQIKVENISPYMGIYLEAGDEQKERVDDVYALKITNVSEHTILNGDLIYNDGEKDLNFYFEMLPIGASVYVVEQNQAAADSDTLTLVNGSINYLEAEMECMDRVELQGTKNSTIKIKNLTEEELSCVWVFYRKAAEDGTLLSGLCYNVITDSIEAEGETEVEAESWMDSCVIVNALALDDPSDREEISQQD